MPNKTKANVPYVMYFPSATISRCRKSLRLPTPRRPWTLYPHAQFQETTATEDRQSTSYRCFRQTSLQFLSGPYAGLIHAKLPSIISALSFPPFGGAIEIHGSEHLSVPLGNQKIPRGPCGLPYSRLHAKPGQASVRLQYITGKLNGISIP